MSVCSVGIQQFYLEREILLLRDFKWLSKSLSKQLYKRLGNDAVIYIVNSLLNHRVNRLENDVIISCISLRTVMWR